mmetsp:Transcript_73288/g.203102  ORF Transcript_73288/g.203102 Transcript_73288/m.203102 type:complete len:399 (+) Transcript_73288:43-1239(+)
MADMSHIGAHCDHPDCRQQDFLPFTCDACDGTFCLAHRTYTGHACTRADAGNATAISCPLCAKTIRLEGDEDPNVTFERHMKGDCDPESRTKRTKKKRCGAKGCREKLVFSNRVTCPKCHMDVCLRHRFDDDHDCKGARATAAARSSWLASFSSGSGIVASPRASAAPSGGSGGFGGGGTARAGAGAGAGSAASASLSAAGRAAAARAEAAAARTAPRRASAGASTAAARRTAGATAARARRVEDPGNTLRGTAGRRRDLGAVASGITPAPMDPAVIAATTGPERCTQCGARFADVGQLIAHSEAYHPAGAAAAAASDAVMAEPSSAAAASASASAGTYAAPRRASASAAGGGARGSGGERCPQCSETFEDVVALVGHVQAVHDRAAVEGERRSCAVS